MTEQEQRIALCEWRGWKHLQVWKTNGRFYKGRLIGTPHEGMQLTYAPDTNSLDVLHEMEMKLDAISDNYLSSPQPNRIYRVMLADRVAGKKLWDNGTFIGSQWDVYGAISATAAQRREALCRTLFPERFKSCKTGTANAQ